MNWYLEFRSIGDGRYFTGTFEQACAEAKSWCVGPTTVVDIYNGQNIRVAAVTQSGVDRSVFPKRQGSSCPD